MYTLKYKPKNESKNLSTSFSLDFENRLKNEDEILFKKKENSISYLVHDKLGYFSFEINDKGKIIGSVCPNLFSSTDLLDIFINHVINTDKNSTPEELQNRYGSLYDDLEFETSLSPKDIETYKQNKKDLQELLDEINADEIPEDIINHNYTFDFSIAGYSDNSHTGYPKFYCAAIADTKKKKDSIYGIRKIITFFTSSKNNSTLDDASQKIIDKLVLLNHVCNGQSDDFYYVRYSADTNLRLYEVLEAIVQSNKNDNLEKSNFYFNNNLLNFDGETKVNINISENGIINADFDFNDILATINVESKKAVIAIYENSYKFLKFSSTKAVKLFYFLKEHPNIRYDLIKKEITTSLIPKVASDVEVAPTLLAKSLKLSNHIELFLSLEEKGIKSETLAFINSKQVFLDEFKQTEEKLFNSFAFEMQKLFLPFNDILEDEDLIDAYLTADLSQLKKTATVFISEDLKKLKKKPLAKINIVLNSGVDWFKLNFTSDEYTEDEIKAILNAYKKKKKFFLLHGDYLALDEGEIGKSIQQMMDDFDYDSKIFDREIPIYQVLKLQDNPMSIITQDIADLFNEIQNYDDVKLDLSDDLLKILRPYQIKGVKWLTMLANHNLGGILADDMGLGKTLEMISFLSQDKTEMPSLIVTPKSLTYNWENEFNQWNNKQEVIVLSLDKDARHEIINNIKPDKNVVYIIPYDSLRIDLDYFKDIQFNYIILDEGQYISNALSKKTRAIKELKANHRFALTGTPIQNSLLDLWSIFDYLMPGYFRSLSEFKKTYGKLDIEEDSKKHLEMIISPFVLKRKKEDVLTELPGKTIEVRTLSMSDEEHKLYQVHLLQAKNLIVGNGQIKKIEVLAALTRLRQICVDPSTFLNFKNISSKLDYTVKFLKQATQKGHKVLVFSSFKLALEHLEEYLNKEEIKTDKITGETSAKRRVELADEFNTKDTIKVLLISLKAGGTGLNLIGADIVIHLDPWWNVASEDQATDRAYRIGQEKKVTVYKLVMKDTVEEKVIALQEKKRILSEVIDQNNSDDEKKSITDEDIKYLLG